MTQPLSSDGLISSLKFLTVKEAAEMMRVSRMTIHRITQKPDPQTNRPPFRVVRVGKSIRIDRQSFLEYLERSWVEP